MTHRRLLGGALAIAIVGALYCALHLHILTVTNRSDGIVMVDLVTLGRDHRHLGEMVVGERRVLVFYKAGARDLGYTVAIEVNGRKFGTKDCGYISRFPTVYDAYIKSDPDPHIVCEKRF